MQTDNNSGRLKDLTMDIFTCGMYGKCEPDVLYKSMMLNLIFIVGTPFVAFFGLYDILHGIQPLGHIISSIAFVLVTCFFILRKTKKIAFFANFLVFILFAMFLYLLATGGSGDSGVLWYYAFPPITLFLLGFRRGSAVVFVSLLAAAAILFWPGTPYLSATYSAEMKIRFIPSVIMLWIVTSLFEHVKTIALRFEIKNTELRDTVEEIKKSRESLQSVVDSIDAVVYVADMQTYEILLLNRYTRMLFGDILGRPCWQALQKGQSGPCSFCTNDRLVGEDGRPLDIYNWEFQSTITQRWYECHDRAIDWIDGRTVRLEIARDITERKNLEAQLCQAQKMEAVGILAGGVAHEFNNILTTIKGSVYIIEKNLKNDDPLNKYSEQINTSINKASSLAQGLLAFSRKQVIDLRPHNLNEIVMRVVRLVSGLIGERIALDVALAEGELTIIADSNQIEQVIINLVTNARDSMENGGRLSIGTGIMDMDEDFIRTNGFGAPGKYAVITVSDTGTGITEEIKEKIFEPFFTTKELGRGTGLGLSIVYGIIKQHEGYIDVKTMPGEGATFMVYIPAVSSDADCRPSQGRTRVIGGCETILLAEDEADTRKIMTDVLKSEGYTVMAAKDGVEALRIFKENMEKIDLALLDVRMPQKDGKEVDDEIKRISPHTKTLFISGYTADVIGEDDFNSAGLNFISKTATPQEILKKIREVLDSPSKGL